MSDLSKLKKEIRFLTHAVVHNGKRSRVHYSKGSYTKESGLPEGTITIYAKEYGSQLPAELNPKNDTEYQTDYFATDTARITPQSKYYRDVLRAVQKAEAKNKKLMDRRRKKYGW